MDKVNGDRGWSNWEEASYRQIIKALVIAVRTVGTGPSPHKSLRKRACPGLALLPHGFMQWSCPKAAHTLEEDTPKCLLIPNSGLVALGRREGLCLFSLLGKCLFSG